MKLLDYFLVCEVYDIYLASDESVAISLETYSYLLSNYEQTVIIEGMGLVFTTATEPQSQRAEYYEDMQ